MRYKALLLLFILLITFSYTAHAKELPIGLQRAIEYNNELASNFALNISFFIAFIAGILSILSPCILPILPAYFSFTFKEKKNITMMSLVFFSGFSLVFVIMGMFAGFVGEQSLAVIQNEWLVTIAGIILITLGIISLQGKGFSSFIKVKKRLKNDVPGVFLSGTSFAVGWTACMGPILFGIISIGAVLGNVLYSGLLLFSYSIGTLLPLFFLSVFYDKFNLGKNKLLRGKLFKFKIAGKKFQIHSTNLISGTLLLIIGIILVIFKGTAIFNTLDLLGTRQYFYSLQEALLSWEHANIFGIIIFTLSFLLIGLFLLKRRK